MPRKNGGGGAPPLGLAKSIHYIIGVEEFCCIVNFQAKSYLDVKQLITEF